VITSDLGDESALSPTERSTVRRHPDRAQADRRALDAVLDSGLLAHVGFVDESGQPFVIPVAYARDGDRLLVHGSTGSRLLRHLATGAPACVTVTHIDGVVVARSAFNSSMNYRSALVFGSFRRLEGDDAAAAVDVITDHLIPGRVSEVRANTKKELAATMVLALDLSEASVKVRAGGPSDEPEDLEAPVWAGVVPTRLTASTAEPGDSRAALLPIPESVRTLIAKLS
jgi:uncharacterized protein